MIKLKQKNCDYRFINFSISRGVKWQEVGVSWLLAKGRCSPSQLAGRMEKVCTKTPNPICHTNEMETMMHLVQLDKLCLERNLHVYFRYCNENTENY